MGLLARFVQATPETVAGRYFGGFLYGTEEQKQELAVGLLLTFKLAHNEQWPKSMDELGRWVDTEFGHHVGHTYVKNWPEFMETIAARHGTTLNLCAEKCLVATN
jgi:hypothetical protein